MIDLSVRFWAPALAVTFRAGMTLVLRTCHGSWGSCGSIPRAFRLLTWQGVLVALWFGLPLLRAFSSCCLNCSACSFLKSAVRLQTGVSYVRCQNRLTAHARFLPAAAAGAGASLRRRWLNRKA